jgi:hypothetical protein
MMKIALILHFPPLIENFNTPINKMPVYPGAVCLAKMRAGCKFYDNGHCIPINLYNMQNPDPCNTLPLQIEPLKEFEEMMPSNHKGEEAAAATCAYLNPNSAIAITAQSTTFGIGTPTLATLQQQVETNNNLEAGGHFQQELRGERQEKTDGKRASFAMSHSRHSMLWATTRPTTRRLCRKPSTPAVICLRGALFCCPLAAEPS